MNGPSATSAPGVTPGGRWSPFRVAMRQLRAARTPRVSPLPEWSPPSEPWPACWVVSVRRSPDRCEVCGVLPGVTPFLSGICPACWTPAPARVTPHPPGFCRGGCAH